MRTRCQQKRMQRFIENSAAGAGSSTMLVVSAPPTFSSIAAVGEERFEALTAIYRNRWGNGDSDPFWLLMRDAIALFRYSMFGLRQAIDNGDLPRCVIMLNQAATARSALSLREAVAMYPQSFARSRAIRTALPRGLR